MKLFWHSLLSLALGLAGGFLAFRLSSKSDSLSTLKARSFEVVDITGRVVARLGPDSTGERFALAFVDHKGQARAQIGMERIGLGIEPLKYIPFTEILGSDGNRRISLRIDPKEQPTIALGDSRSEARILLGHWERGDYSDGKMGDLWDNWALSFKDQGNTYLDLGATTPLGSKERIGYVSLRDSSKRQLRLKP